MGRIIAYVGGARSGKSRLAVERARSRGEAVVFVATLEPLDEEMRERIELHRRARPDSWTTVEAPRELARAIAEIPPRTGCVVVDCLTLWISNLLGDGRGEEAILGEFENVLAAARRSPAETIFVSNEVGCGVVPESAAGREFRDVAGLVNQRRVAAADEALWVVCGKAVGIS